MFPFFSFFFMKIQRLVDNGTCICNVGLLHSPGAQDLRVRPALKSVTKIRIENSFSPALIIVIPVPWLMNRGVSSEITAGNIIWGT